MNWQEQFQKYQQALSGVTAQDVGAACDDMGDSYDNGNLMPILNATEENAQYQIRILPDFTMPAQWWLNCWLYNYHPPGLKAGFSPKTFGEVDPFDQWLRGVVPYDKDRKNPISNAFAGCFPSQKALALVLVRSTHKDIKPNTIYCWMMPVKKGGFTHVIEPVIRSWGAHMGPQCIDLFNGREAMFTVVGDGFNRSLANFQWIGNQCPAADQQTLDWLFTNQYKPLKESHRRLTQEDMQEYIAYYEPIVEAFTENPALAEQVTQGQKSRGARGPNAHALAIAWLKNKKAGQGPQPPTGLPMAPPQPNAWSPPAGPPAGPPTGSAPPMPGPFPWAPSQPPTAAPPPSTAAAPPPPTQQAWQPPTAAMPPMGTTAPMPPAGAPAWGPPQQPAAPPMTPPMGPPSTTPPIGAPPMGAPPMPSPSQPSGPPAGPPMGVPQQPAWPQQPAQ